MMMWYYVEGGGLMGRYYHLLHKETGWTSEGIWSLGVKFPGLLTKSEFFKDSIHKIAVGLRYDKGVVLSQTDRLYDSGKFVWIPVGVRIAH